MSFPETRISQLIRYLRPDGNPLRRPVDCVHCQIVVALFVSFLIVGPAVVTAVARATYGAGLRDEQREAGTRHRVYATVLSTSPITSGSSTAQTTPVRWRDASGLPRLGVVPRGSADRPGALRQIWLDAAGEATPHPRGPRPHRD